jgi:hypothetical protein
VTEQTLPRPQLLTTAELKAWLKVSQMWVKERLDDPEFVAQCVINLAPKTSERRTLRYSAEAVANWLDIPAPPQQAPATASSAAA